jgi:hypothetical protein
MAILICKYTATRDCDQIGQCCTIAFPFSSPVSSALSFVRVLTTSRVLLQVEACTLNLPHRHCLPKTRFLSPCPGSYQGSFGIGISGFPPGMCMKRTYKLEAESFLLSRRFVYETDDRAAVLVTIHRPRKSHNTVSQRVWRKHGVELKKK